MSVLVLLILSTLASAAEPVAPGTPSAIRQRIAALEQAIQHAQASEQRLQTTVDTLNKKRQGMILVYLQIMTEQAPIMLQDKAHYNTYMHTMEDDYGALVRQIVDARASAREATTVRKSLEQQRADLVGQRIELPSQD